MTGFKIELYNVSDPIIYTSRATASTLPPADCDAMMRAGLVG